MQPGIDPDHLDCAGGNPYGGSAAITGRTATWTKLARSVVGNTIASVCDLRIAEDGDYLIGLQAVTLDFSGGTEGRHAPSERQPRDEGTGTST